MPNKHARSFPDSPPIRAYLHHAYCTGLLQAHKRFEALVATHYVNLELRRGDPFSKEEVFLDFHPYVDINTIAGYAGCTTVDFSCASVPVDATDELMNYLSTLLESNFAVLVYIDAYYMPWSAAFGRTHVSIQHLLSSCEKGRFHGYNYRKDSSFGPCLAMAHDLRHAMANQNKIASKEQGTKLVRAVSFQSMPPDIVSCPRSLRCFARSEPLQEDLRQSDYVYGANCYSALKAVLQESLAEYRPVDLRKTRLLCERMAAIRDWARKGLGANATRACERFDQALAMLQSAHLVAYQYNLGSLTSHQVAAKIEESIENAGALDIQGTIELLSAYENHTNS